MSDLISNPEKYFRQFVPKRDPLLIDLEEEARQEEIPIVGPVVGELLYVLASVVHAERILELGTAMGYSSIFMAKALPLDRGKLVTIDNNQQMLERAYANFRKAGLHRKIDTIVGDAQDKLAEIIEPFDLIFLDIDKEFYTDVLPACSRLMKQGGLLIADNVGFKDAVPFNQMIYDSPKWKSVTLLTYLPFHSPEWDGLCLATKS